MKVIAVHQPWAWAIAQGYKRVENRTWATKHRGPLLIQATQRWRRREVEAILAELLADGRIPALPDLAELEATCGHIVARVELTGVREVLEGDPDPWAIPGGYAFELEAVERLVHVPCTGFQRIFNLPEELIPRLVPIGGRSLVIWQGPPEPWVPDDWPRTPGGDLARCPCCGSFDLDDSNPPDVDCNSCLAAGRDPLTLTFVEGVALPSDSPARLWRAPARSRRIPRGPRQLDLELGAA